MNHLNKIRIYTRKEINDVPQKGEFVKANRILTIHGLYNCMILKIIYHECSILSMPPAIRAFITVL